MSLIVHPTRNTSVQKFQEERLSFGRLDLGALEKRLVDDIASGLFSKARILTRVDETLALVGRDPRVSEFERDSFRLAIAKSLFSARLAEYAHTVLSAAICNGEPRWEKWEASSPGGLDQYLKIKVFDLRAEIALHLGDQETALRSWNAAVGNIESALLEISETPTASKVFRFSSHSEFAELLEKVQRKVKSINCPSIEVSRQALIGLCSDQTERLLSDIQVARGLEAGGLSLLIGNEIPLHTLLPLQESLIASTGSTPEEKSMRQKLIAARWDLTKPLIQSDNPEERLSALRAGLSFALSCGGQGKEAQMADTLCLLAEYGADQFPEQEAIDFISLSKRAINILKIDEQREAVDLEHSVYERWPTNAPLRCKLEWLACAICLYEEIGDTKTARNRVKAGLDIYHRLERDLSSNQEVVAFLSGKARHLSPVKSHLEASSYSTAFLDTLREIIARTDSSFTEPSTALSDESLLHRASSARGLAWYHQKRGEIAEALGYYKLVRRAAKETSSYDSFELLNTVLDCAEYLSRFDYSSVPVYQEIDPQAVQLLTFDFLRIAITIVTKEKSSLPPLKIASFARQCTNIGEKLAEDSALGFNERREVARNLASVCQNVVRAVMRDPSAHEIDYLKVAREFQEARLSALELSGAEQKVSDRAARNLRVIRARFSTAWREKNHKKR